ncbi:hypothetical protein KC343_g9145 [Hortaea werneckii]|nr:hypothetical protein KC338_g8154 [Hortaea werneckii]KAI7181618.1 hypothetical protein KC352_g23349 [Hortaea werneckii]KAI7346036.1 hypothetical protein KC320_g8063 [Hortaea werneckii]KAI7558657.1 hypothetical protein KC317_g10868 [Hortaea werneckii]KAI7610298.1 hypothetical protein KC346_g8799 [Hortaea werneckii]
MTVDQSHAKTLESRAESFQVIQPTTGQTVTLSEDDDISIHIAWSSPSDIVDRPVFINLMQGTSVDSLELVETVNASAPNNGSYTWYEDYGNILYYSVGSTRDYGAASGCNYTFSLKVWQNEYYSPYFTIIKPVDGGIPSNATCPQDLGIERPRADKAYPTVQPTQAQSEDTSRSTASSGSVNTGGEEAPKSNSPTVPVSTLAIAVAVPIAALLAAFILFMWLAFHKGWFRRRSPEEARPEEIVEGKHRQESVPHKGPLESELHGRSRPYEGDGTQVYEIYSDHAK